MEEDGKADEGGERGKLGSEEDPPAGEGRSLPGSSTTGRPVVQSIPVAKMVWPWRSQKGRLPKEGDRARVY